MIQILMMLLGLGAGVFLWSRLGRGRRRWSPLDGDSVSEEWRRERRRQRDDA